MLWTDADFITLADLASVDPDIVSTAASLEITLTGESGMIRRSVEQAARKLESILVNFTTYVSSNDLSANHQNAVFYTGSQPNNRLRYGLEQIVVSGRNDAYWSPLKQWAVNQALIRFYVAASSRAEGDRYESKLESFKIQDRNEYWPQMRSLGVPIVNRPLSAPAAAQARNPGSWRASAVSNVAGLNAGTYDVAITWIDSTRYVSAVQNGNAESQPAVAQQVTVTVSQVISVDITRLTPPDGSVEPAQQARSFVVPLTATGWNVYARPTGTGDYTLQNSTPIDVAVKTYALAADPTTTGAVAGTGQYADVNVSVPDLLMRG